MLFNFWQLKTIVHVLFLASCLGQEPFRVCSHDYCIERSVERRISVPTNLKISHRFRNEDFERKDPTRRNHRLSEENLREISKRVEEQTRSDVIRHLDENSFERLNQYILGRLDGSREQRQTLRQLNVYQHTTQKHLDHDKKLRCLNKGHIETINREENRKIFKPVGLKDNRNERHESIRQLDEHGVDRRSGVAPERIYDIIVKQERELTLRYNDAKQKQIEGSEALSRIEDYKADYDTKKHSDDFHEFQRVYTQYSGTQPQVKSRERYDSFRRLDEQEGKRRVSGRLKLNRKDRHHTLRRLDDYTAQHDINSPSKCIDEQFSRDEREPNQRRNENNVERHLCRRDVDVRAVNRRFDRVSEFEYSVEKVYKNEQAQVREQRSQIEYSKFQRDVNIKSEETYKECDDKRRSRVIYDLQRIYEQLSQGNHEPSNHREEYPYQIGRPSQSERKLIKQWLTRFDDRKVCGNDNRRRLEVMHKKHRDRHFEGREIQQEVNRRLGDTRESKRLDEEHSRRKWKSIRHHNKVMRERIERRLKRCYVREAQRYSNNHLGGDNDDHDSQHDVSNHLDHTRKDYYQISRQLYEREVDSRLNVAHGTQRINRQIHQRHHELIQYRGENKWGHYNTLIRFDNRNAQRDTTSHIIEEVYSEKPAVFLKKSYIVLGQGAILAYVIMKTLNGKNNLKNQLLIGLRDVVKITGF